ncbi:MAG: hypothetical protein KAH22_00945 [Thiotrichaceae bacterium]|nr:hypothetical protein [Thiotrichaceae bacterium]
MLNKQVFTIVCSIFYLLPFSTEANNKVSYCNFYAQTAMTQSEKNISYQCGFKSKYWNPKAVTHNTWCLKSNKGAMQTIEANRKKLLGACYKKFATINNPKNHLELPSSCIESQGRFTPIRSYYDLHTHSKDKLQSPVKEGLIKNDFNHDNIYDYVFIEENSFKRIQLVACFSRKGKPYQRIITNTHLSYAKKNLKGSYHYYIEMQENLLQITKRYTHTKGSSSATLTYQYNGKGFRPLD